MNVAVVAVVVSHNRRDLLMECLTALAAQSRRPDAVVVVDNASSDGSATSVRNRFPDADLVSLARNTGGAGGFAAGLARALEDHRADLVWLMDDDTVPTSDALAELLQCWNDHRGRPALVASRVVWHDGRDHPMNSPRRRPRVAAREVEDAHAVSAEPVRSASFVSVLVDGAAVRAVGLPVAGYFIWNDDFEFTTRLLRDRVGLASSRSVVVHKTRTFGSTDADPGSRFRFEVRNKLWLFTRSRGLRPAEKLLYGGATLLRWVRTVRRSRDRRTLLRSAAEGLREGLRHGPPSTSAVLADLGPVSERVRAVELRATR